MISIDGSAGEGGGQILRTAIGLSALTGQRVEINGIRAQRPNPGLAAQHLAALRCVASICNAEMEGAQLGSTRVVFSPGRIEGGTFDVDIGTAGAITLVLQAAVLPACFAAKPVVLRFVGGTDVSWSPSIDYFRHVLAPIVRRFCAKLSITVTRRGYYPAGGGQVEVKITPGMIRASEGMWTRFAPIIAAKVPSLTIVKRGSLKGVRGVAHASASLSSKKPAEAMAEAARFMLSSLRVPIDIEVEYSAAPSAGGGITLWALFTDSDDIDDTTLRMGASALLGQESTSEAVGQRAAKELIASIRSDAAVDPHLADQLIPFLALAGTGSLNVQAITEHCRTNMAVTTQMIGVTFSLDKDVITRVS